MFIFLIAFYLTKLVCGKDEKIFGGNLAKEGEYPFVVFLEETNLGTRGTGFLLSLGKVMTCGSFFQQGFQVGKVNMVAGTVDLSLSSRGLQKRSVAAYKVHAQFDNRLSSGKLNKNDIACVTPDRPFDPSSTVKPGSIVSTDAYDFKTSWREWVTSRSLCHGVGWGTTTPNGNKTNLLLVLGMTPVSDIDCQAKTELTSTGIVCALNNKKGDSLCTGDFGGPLICNGLIYAVSNPSPESCGQNSTYNYYLSLWPFVDYFDLHPETGENATTDGATLQTQIPVFNAALPFSTVILLTLNFY